MPAWDPSIPDPDPEPCNTVDCTLTPQTLPYLTQGRLFRPCLPFVVVSATTMLAAGFAPAFVVRPATQRLTTRQQAPCYCMAQPPAAASNETTSGKAQCSLAFDGFGLHTTGGASPVFRTPSLHDCARSPTSGRAAAATESLRVPAGQSADFCTIGAQRPVCLAHPALAYAEAEDAGHEVEAALTLPALDSPQSGAATRLPLAQATALALAYAEQRSRRGGTDSRAKRKCGPGSFGSLGGEAAYVEDASDGSLRWVRA